MKTNKIYCKRWCLKIRSILILVTKIIWHQTGPAASEGIRRGDSGWNPAAMSTWISKCSAEATLWNGYAISMAAHTAQSLKKLNHFSMKTERAQIVGNTKLECFESHVLQVPRKTLFGKFAIDRSKLISVTLHFFCVSLELRVLPLGAFWDDSCIKWKQTPTTKRLKLFGPLQLSTPDLGSPRLAISKHFRLKVWSMYPTAATARTESIMISSGSLGCFPSLWLQTWDVRLPSCGEHSTWDACEGTGAMLG